MKVSRELIAYNDLKKLVIEPGFCILCGACEAACPIHALKIEHDELHYLFDCSNHVEFCPICYDVCPFTEALLLETLGFVTDAPNRRESIGYYRKIVLAQARDEKLRELSHSGGVVAALLLHGIKTDFIDSAVVSESEEEAPIRLRPSISLVPDDLLSAVDCKYFPSAVAKAFGKAVHEYGKLEIAFVGTPCHVRAIRKLEAWEHKIINSLKIVIGLICLWSFSYPELTKFLRENHNIEADDIKRIDLDRKYRILTKDNREIAISPSEVRDHTLNSCRMCQDFTAELADISVGGAHPLTDWSIVIIRTEEGEKLFNDAIRAGVLNVKSIEEEPEVYRHFVEMAILKRQYAIEEVEKRKRSNKPIPPAFMRTTELLPREESLLSMLKAEQIMTRDVITISPEATAEEILSMMTRHHHMGYPLVNEKNELVGIVTFEDISKVPASKRAKTLAKEIAHKKLITVNPEASAMEVYEKMSKHKIGRILVVDKKEPKKLLGIITKTDILHILRWPMKRKR
ncbi:hypothetical protein DRO54_10455 [Candidatus Bathyarchaeota archaeon]|nr:MAG: hypothetical protein DRO54_10455 [Candidatus Bathyarchaeota archaeon]